MKRMKYSLIFFLFLLSMLVVPTITAQNATDEIQYKITGRMLMDGGIYLKNPVDFGNGTEFNDLRIGMKATYRNWKMKLEMGLKLRLRMPLPPILIRSIPFRSVSSMNRLVWICFAVRLIFALINHRVLFWH